jgi:hypothetical protein
MSVLTASRTSHNLSRTPNETWPSLGELARQARAVVRGGASKGIATSADSLGRASA